MYKQVLLNELILNILSFFTVYIICFIVLINIYKMFFNPEKQTKCHTNLIDEYPIFEAAANTPLLLSLSIYWFTNILRNIR